MRHSTHCRYFSWCDLVTPVHQVIVLIICTDGQVFTWGLGDNGELGHGPEVNYRPVPTLVEGLGAQTFRNITTSLHFTGAITGASPFRKC